MRLLHVRTLEFQEFGGDGIPKYIIASHRWSEDEPTFSTFADHRERNSEGYQKVVGFCNTVKPNGEAINNSIDWLWIDTCCIDVYMPFNRGSDLKSGDADSDYRKPTVSSWLRR